MSLLVPGLARQRRINAAFLGSACITGLTLYPLGLRPPALVWVSLLMLALLSRKRQPRAAFVVDGRSFSALGPVLQAAPATVWFAGCLTESLAFLSDPLRRHPIQGYFVVGSAVILAVLGVLAVWRPWFIALTPDGLAYCCGPRTRLFRWDELTEPITMAAGSVKVRRKRYIGHLDFRVDTGFLADAIEHYRLFPQHRAAIGTAAEHARLQQAIHEWTATYVWAGATT